MRHRCPVTLHYTVCPAQKPGPARRAAWATILAAGFEAPYFTFQSDDTEGRARALDQAQHVATDWTARSGVQLQPVEGMFL